MLKAIHGISARRSPRMAAAAALLLLACQLIAVSHWHVKRIRGQGLPATVSSVSNPDLCPVCLLAFHCPVSSAAGPALQPPRTEDRPLPSFHRSFIRALAVFGHLVRAPPLPC